MPGGVYPDRDRDCVSDTAGHVSCRDLDSDRDDHAHTGVVG